MNMSLWIVILLAVVQGLTEFFPVSSSGHLVMLEALFGTREGSAGTGLMFEIAVHIGTLGAVIIFYRRKVMLLCKALLASIFAGRGGYDRYRNELRYIGLVILGTIPAAIIGALFSDQIETTFDSPSLSAAFLVATGIYLLMTRMRAIRGSLGWQSALIIGVAQAIAILPGCSRSGWTIATGLLLGVGFAEAAEYSFMLSIPAILGALVLTLVKEPGVLSPGSLAPLAIGVAAAFLAGLVALKLLIGILNRGAFHRFAYYLLPVGIAAFIYFRFLA
ncbi:MAG: undecaprenyl-diphosphate phosphatase [Candidatus Krumholzibacteria bacterium]|nr:undecaprenyl-diphosphate phosphatase [Candidatus Krumholzibacteria bacterium]